MFAGSGWKIVLVLMSAAVTVHAADAPSASADEADGEAVVSRYKQAQIALYDALRSDASPARQVLAGRLYVDDDDTPSALRPKSADVVARAAGLAPNDAFVQWLAADVGNYYSSQCGPTRWPEAEVANLVRLESDNAGALQYAAALAHAKGDQAAVDDALARMASARRADDHLGDEIAAWTRAYVAHPIASPFDDTSGNSDASPQSSALATSLQQTGFRSSPVESALEESCKPAADSDRTWQRLGWCADAGVLLATRGNSFTLRGLGLKMLAAAGATADDLADLQRQFDWLKTNAATPMQNGAAFADAPSDRAADWNAAPSEIVATERRLKRLGKPLTPPAGWMAANDEESTADAEGKAARQSWQDYVKALTDDLRGSGNARDRALGLASGASLSAWFVDDGERAANAANATTKPAADTALADLAAASPADLLVQWIAATASGDTRDAAALANAQRLDKDNAAAWGMSLGDPAVDATQTLQHMAASHRYDEHSADILPIWLAVVKRHPVPAEMTRRVQEQSPEAKFSDDDIAASTAVMLAAITAVNASSYAKVNAACTNADAARKPLCVAAARLMFDGAHTLMATVIGEMVLRRFDALSPEDRIRARRLAWWRENSMSLLMTGSDAFNGYMRDLLATGSEIDALRLAATRAGKAEPPADWKSPDEKQAARAQAKKATPDH